MISIEKLPFTGMLPLEAGILRIQCLLCRSVVARSQGLGETFNEPIAQSFEPVHHCDPPQTCG